MQVKTLVFVLFFLIFVCTNVHTQPLFQHFLDNLSTAHGLEEARKKKKHGGYSGDKYMVPLLYGALLVKSVIFPLAFKAIAVMSSIAVVLSTMSLIFSSIVGFIKLATKSTTPVKIVHKLPHGSWAKEDNIAPGKNYYNYENNDLVALQ